MEFENNTENIVIVDIIVECLTNVPLSGTRKVISKMTKKEKYHISCKPLLLAPKKTITTDNRFKKDARPISPKCLIKVDNK